MDLQLRRLTLDDMDAAARVHRQAFDDRLPWLSGLHTPQEDSAFYRGRVFATCALWGGFDADGLAGFIAYRAGWIDQFYVHPGRQGGGLGSALLEQARTEFDAFALWTFQRNRGARRFYERRGFVQVETSDGAHNEEREPDVRYVWSRNQEDAA